MFDDLDYVANVALILLVVRHDLRCLFEVLAIKRVCYLALNANHDSLVCLIADNLSNTNLAARCRCLS
jgi:hypothetical protein